MDTFSWRGKVTCHPLPPVSEEPCPMPSTSPLVQSPGPSAPGPSFFLENLLGSCFPGPPTATASSLIPPDTNLTVRSLLNTPRQCFLHAPGNEQAPGPGITGLTCWALATPPSPPSLILPRPSVQSPDLCGFGVLFCISNTFLSLPLSPLSLCSCRSLCLEHSLSPSPHARWSG